MPGTALNPYLAEVLAGLNGGQGQYALAPPPEEDPNAIVSAPAPVASVQAPIVGPTPTPAPPTAGITLPTDDPATLTSRAPPSTSQGPTGVLAGSDVPANTNAVQVGAPANDGPPAVGPDPHAFDLQLQGGGAVPAHEMDLRGPSLTTAQNERQATYANTIGTVAGRNAQAANDEAQMYVSQERAARLREAAYQQSIAEQEEELQARQDDFDQTARQMARLGQVDHGRFWASRSTGQKIAGAIEVMLAGFLGAPSMVMKRIDDDVRAQEFAYNAARDQANARQTAFGAAMAKYGNINAARAMARVASLDVVSAQLGQIAAMNKGNDTGNRALEALAQLSNDRMLMIQQGIKFVPAQAGQRYFINPNAPGVIYNNKEAQEYHAKNMDRREARAQKAADIGGQLTVQNNKYDREDAAGDGIGKENAQKLALEERKATIERDALLNAIGAGQQNVKAIVKGGVIDNGLAHAPASAPFAAEARANVAARESYNNTARLAVAAAYKLSTDATEPKNRALLEEYAAPYMIDAGDNEKSATNKMILLRGLVTKGAASKGVLPPGQTSTSPAMPGSFTMPSKK